MNEAGVADAITLLASVIILIVIFIAINSNKEGKWLFNTKVLRVPLESNIVTDIPDNVVIEGIRDNGNGTKDISLIENDTDLKETKQKVVKFKSKLDGRYYFVCATLPEKQKASDTLAEIYRRSQLILFDMNEKLDANERIVAGDGVDITENIRKMVAKHYNKPLALAEYHAPNDKTVGANSEKGLLIEMCLRSKSNPAQWNSINTLTRVHIHELAHSADFMFRADGTENHGPDFYRIMNYILQQAEELGLYSCAEYKASGNVFCGLILNEEDTRCG